MNRQMALIFCLALAMMACAAGFLGYVEKHQRLGAPGVRLVAQRLYDEHGHLVASNSVYLPPTILGAESAELPVTRVELNWLPADTTFGRRRYYWPDRPEVQLSVVLMGADRTSIHRPEFCLAGQGWEFRPADMEVVKVPMQRPMPYELSVMKVIMKRQTRGGEGEFVERGIYLYWFVNDREITPYHAGRMWSLARHMLREGELQRWAYISLFARYRPSQEAATLAWLKQVIAAGAPEFQLPPLAVEGQAAGVAGGARGNP